jgi:aminopeptidase YwaD
MTEATAMLRVGRQAALATLALTQSLLDDYPARIAGTYPCLAAGRRMAALLKSACDSVAEEDFAMHPQSLWDTGKVVAVAYVGAALLLAAGGPFTYGAVLVCWLGLIYAVTHYILCGKLFDGLFPRAQGCNAAGVLEPADRVKQQILLVGHHDSPYVLSFLLRFQKWASLRLLLAVVAYLLLTLAGMAAGAGQALGAGGGLPREATLIGAAVGLVFVGPLYFLVPRIPSPGAGDNLNACAMAVQVAGYFAAQSRAGRPLRHTRLVFLSADGEEAGQRGAIAYAERHEAELTALPTFVLNVDSVYKVRDLAVLTRDRHGTMPLSARMARECHEVAARLGYSLREMALSPGSGSTDAAAFAQIGVEATSIIGVSAAPGQGRLVYHTPWDTVDAIEPEVVEAVLNIAVNYIVCKDRQASGQGPDLQAGLEISGDPL